MTSIFVRSKCRPSISLVDAKISFFAITPDIINCIEKTDSHVMRATNYAILNASCSLTDIDIAMIRLHMY